MDPIDVSNNRFVTTLGANSVTTFVSEYTPVSTEEVAPTPGSRHLLQNYPNPFRSTTSIGYNVPRSGEVTLEVSDLLGRKASTLTSGPAPAGRHEAAFEASGLPAGMYVYRLKAGDVVQTRMMTMTE